MMNIFFDLDDTLLDHSGAMREGAMAFYRQFEDRLGGGGAEGFVARWEEALEPYYAKFLSGEITFQQQRRGRVRDVIGETITDQEADRMLGVYLRNYEQAWAAFDDVEPALTALGEAKLGIITNGAAEQQRRKLRALGIEDRFRVVLTSEEAGAAKPDPAIFAQACRRIEAEPRTCLYVGDQLETDAQAAARAGLKGVWLNRANAQAAEPGVDVISSLLELPRIAVSSD